MKTKNIIIRSLSGTVYVGALVGAVLSGGVWIILLTSILAFFAVYEFLAMTSEGKIPRFASALDISAAVILQIAVGMLQYSNRKVQAALIGVYLLLLVVRAVTQLYAEHGNPVHSLARSFMAQMYIAMPLAIFSFLCSWFPPQLILAMLIFIWVNDTGAFCVGSTMGKHKLFERISPKKTWEGFWGGMLFCVIAAVVMCACFNQYSGFSYGFMCRFGIVVSVFATFGDLIESMIKRTCGVKDSGKLIPGHGGILDRIDSLLLVVPVTLIYLCLAC
ncbi:MAG: phosphatidate cytidylyltransferase [Barnesiella sp.]|nr:phosphatidate cytidylyltransferase [Barnesiella sp.]MBD5257866.1 phosphatidate cytidylyltransferase [Barnesiella sp.]